MTLGHGRSTTIAGSILGHGIDHSSTRYNRGIIISNIRRDMFARTLRSLPSFDSSQIQNLVRPETFKTDV